MEYNCTDYNDRTKDYQDIIDIARKIGDLRFQLITKAKEEQERLNSNYKSDITFLHRVEFSKKNNLTDSEKVALWDAEQEERDKRRVSKDRQIIIQMLLKGFNIKNPSKAVHGCIFENENIQDMKVVVENIMKNPELFVQQVNNN